MSGSHLNLQLRLGQPPALGLPKNSDYRPYKQKATMNVGQA